MPNTKDVNRAPSRKTVERLVDLIVESTRPLPPFEEMRKVLDVSPEELTAALDYLIHLLDEDQ